MVTMVVLYKTAMTQRALWFLHRKEKLQIRINKQLWLFSVIFSPLTQNISLVFKGLTCIILTRIKTLIILDIIITTIINSVNQKHDFQHVCFKTTLNIYRNVYMLTFHHCLHLSAGCDPFNRPKNYNFLVLSGKFLEAWRYKMKQMS